ncbi:MAG: YggS family pyridoxal phosphate-dependent enzyme [Acutalibacteraceae bacterium]
MTEKWLNDEELTAKIAALEENYKIVTENVAQAAIKSGRKPEEITLLAATKTVPVPVINRAIELGVTCIGENKVQELCEKYDQLHLEHCDCHFIGHLQTNKVKQLIGKVSMIHSVDSVKLAKEISKISQQQHLVTDILVEINVGKEESKGGIYIEDTESFLGEISTLSGISVKGLMTIPPADENITKTIHYFENMYKKWLTLGLKIR